MIGDDQKRVKWSVDHPYSFVDFVGQSKSCDLGKFCLFGHEKEIVMKQFVDDLKSAWRVDGIWFNCGACGVSGIRDGEDFWQWSRLEIRLNAFRRSTTLQKQFIIIIIIIIIIIFCWFVFKVIVRDVEVSLHLLYEDGWWNGQYVLMNRGGSRIA